MMFVTFLIDVHEDLGPVFTNETPEGAADKIFAHLGGVGVPVRPRDLEELLSAGKISQKGVGHVYLGVVEG